MKLALPSLILLLTLTAWAAPWSITPGSGVGNITVGMDAAIPDKLLTKPQCVGLDNGLVTYIYKDEGLELQCEQKTRKIVAIIITKPGATVAGQPVDYLASGGVRVGSTVAQMEQAFGRNYQRSDTVRTNGAPLMQDLFFAYRGLGIGFTCRNNTVTGITIYAAKH